MAFAVDLIIFGAMEHLTPILMTRLLRRSLYRRLYSGGNRPGHEIEHPMAVVILDGLASSTVLNLLVMPVLYWRFASKK